MGAGVFFSWRWTLAATCLLCAACDIPIPSGVYSCSKDTDCPDGFVCDAADRCVLTQLADANKAADGGVGEPAQPGNSCTRSDARACTDVGSRSRVQCKDEIWTTLADCAQDKVCDLGTGECIGVPKPCAGKEPGEKVCDGERVASCSGDLTELETPEDCPENSRCSTDSGMPECTCDAGYAKDDEGSCQNVDDCPEDACTPGGKCVDGLEDYSCECDEGYSGSGEKSCKDIDDCADNPCGDNTNACVDKVNDFSCTCEVGFRTSSKTACTNINECSSADTNVCNELYPCRDRPGNYYCHGQFLQTPMPDISRESSVKPRYTADADTVYDEVTKLRWERNLPEIYPSYCQPLVVDGVQLLEKQCTWDEARMYCDNRNLGGFTEWRLPSKIELESLLDLVSDSTTAWPSVFPPTPAGDFWTSSRYSLEPVTATGVDQYHYVNFGEGWSFFSVAVDKFKVRCVR
jgi:hypothetical protein